MPTPTSPRTHAVAEWFNLRRRDCLRSLLHGEAHSLSRNELLRLVPAPGRITLITGPSGGGKSSLLRAIRRAVRGSFRPLDLQRLPLAHLPVVDLFPELDVPETMRHLARFGLGEIWSYLKRPDQLSAGQQQRLRIALGIHRAQVSPSALPPLLIADEFAALLDRLTARIVANRLASHVARHAQRAILVTSHDDLTRVLNPNTVVRCDFNSIKIDPHPRKRKTPN